MAQQTTQTAARHPFSLRYVDEALERDYREKLLPRARQQLRVSLISSYPTWILTGAVVQLAAGEWQRPWMIVGAMAVFLTVLLLLQRRAETLTGVHLLGAISNAVPGCTFLWLLEDVGLFDAIGPFAMVPVAVYSFTLLGLPFLVSVSATTPYLLYCLVLTATSSTMAFPLGQASLLLVATGVLAISAYLREAVNRRDFFLTRVIADQERQLEKAKQLGAYTLESKLGQGGMGVVYRARHRLLRRPTAVKLLSTDDAGAGDLARFEREVQLTSELSHPNVVAIYDYGHSPTGEFYYAMEYLPGVDLETLVRDWGPLSPKRAVPILMQVCDALEAAHHRGLIHRDIKPGNILLSRIDTRVDVAKVLDFGLVKEMAAPSDLTGDDHIAGTPAYLAPEALTDPDSIGPASDLYALGAVGFYLMTGERVFEGKTIAEVFGHHLHTPPRPPSVIAAEIPPALDAVIVRCLAKDPAKRYRSASALRAALEAIDLPAYAEGEDWWDGFEAERGVEPAESTDVPLLPTLPLTVDLRNR